MQLLSASLHKSWWSALLDTYPESVHERAALGPLRSCALCAGFSLVVLDFFCCSEQTRSVLSHRCGQRNGKKYIWNAYMKRFFTFLLKCVCGIWVIPLWVVSLLSEVQSWKPNPNPKVCTLSGLCAEISASHFLFSLPEDNCSLKDTGAISGLFSLMGFVHLCSGLFWSDYKYSHEEERAVA